jgi:SAM-dependent methyltransferase
MNIEKKVYVHTPDVHHNDNSPKEIVPIIAQILKPKSVIDIGCGVGNFLREFKNNGIEDILGVDGEWADLDEIERNVGKNNFISYNLNNIYQPGMKYDLAISFEVAEHIDDNFANNFVKTLTNCSDNIVFSAAIPLQGGQNHINEQWNEYWIDKFDKLGYTCIDFLKPYFWDNENVFWWYKQNILFFTTTPKLYQDKLDVNKLDNVIHKDLFKLKTAELELLRKTKIEYESIVSGRYTWKFYFKNLIKSLINIFCRKHK